MPAYAPFGRLLFMFVASAALLSSAVGQAPANERPPATPLIVHDPYFSLWSDTDKLTDSPTRHWTGHAEPLQGLVRIDGKTMRFMGSDPEDLPAMHQVSRELTATHTRYGFDDAGVHLELSFFTPAFLDDLDLLSRPVTYLTWTANSIDGKQHAVSVFLGASADLATSFEHQPVTFARHRTAMTQTLSVGSREQSVLNRSGDDLRIDWGYFHLVVPDNESAQTSIASGSAQSFQIKGSLPTLDSMEGVTTAGGDSPQLAVMLPLGNVGADPVTRHLLVSYTEGFAIQYMQRNLRPYWQRHGKPVATMLDEAEAEYAALDVRGNKFDTELSADLTKLAGEHYQWLCILAYRQAIAAHKLVADENGQPMLFAKENFSNGDTGTVDVLYPSAPLLLFFNPRLLEAQVLPVLEYSALPGRWRFPFAPHDLGQYPLANGQNYGGGENTEDDQMPVEESGNLIILVDAIARTEGSTALAERFWPQLTQWAEYLKLHGLDPENQLTTDDFAGHVAHNSNLSLKAIDALGAYSDLAHLLHHEETAKQFGSLAKTMAGQWVVMAKEGDHYKIAFNSPGTWSQKYNLVWDKVLDYNLFPASVREAEVAFYKTKLNVYGLPLDSRKTYTKADWSIWTATLADNDADFNAILDPIYKWANETTSRVPMTDWYDTISGKQVGFQARSVVGGFYIKALADKKLAAHWRARSESTAPSK